ncbi:MAG: hypothetical protein HKM06_01720 [Spirochaetales bacterium]|nr:hypothetical protein [Spirochaetales bacterium]
MKSQQLVNVYFLNQIPKKILRPVLGKVSRNHLRGLIEVGSIDSSLKGILKRTFEVCHEVLRKIKKMIISHSSLEIETLQEPEFQISKEDFLALRSISPIEKLRIQYAFFRGYSVEQIADLMALDLDLVKKMTK